MERSHRHIRVTALASLPWVSILHAGRRFRTLRGIGEDAQVRPNMRREARIWAQVAGSIVEGMGRDA